jgi:hypothetical protein
MMRFSHKVCLLALSLVAIVPACSPAPTSAPSGAPTSAPAEAKPTQVSAPTDAPLATPSVTPRPTSGVAAEPQPDGSTIFFDFDNGYSVTLPAGWTVVPLNNADLPSIVEAVSKSNPGLPEAPTACFGDIEPETIRSISLYAKPEFVTDALAPNIGIVRIDDPLAAKIPMSYVLPNVVSDREKDGTVTNSEIREIAGGLQGGVVDVEADCLTPSGENIATVQRAAVFQTGKVAIALALMAPAEFAEQLLPTADAVIASITLLQ